MQQLKGSSGGFTLVEVVIGMTLMAFVFSTALGTYFLGLDLVESSRDEVRASQIIQSELEGMRTLNWSDLQQLPASATITPQGEFVSQYASRYTLTRDVQDISGTNGTQKYVVLRVQWTDSKGKTATHYFNTVFSQFGLNDYYYRTP